MIRKFSSTTITRQYLEYRTTIRKRSTGSAKRLYKKGWTSSKVSGPPRFSNSTPILSSPTRGDVNTSGVLEVNNVPNGREWLLMDPQDTNSSLDDPKKLLTRIKLLDVFVQGLLSSEAPAQWNIL